MQEDLEVLNKEREKLDDTKKEIEEKIQHLSVKEEDLEKLTAHLMLKDAELAHAVSMQEVQLAKVSLLFSFSFFLAHYLMTNLDD